MYKADPGVLDFEDELGAIKASVSVSGPKKKKKKKAGAKLKSAFKKIGKVAAVVATGGIAAAPMLKKGKLGKKIMAKVKGKAKAVIPKIAGKVKAKLGLGGKLLGKIKAKKAKKTAAKKKTTAKKPKLPSIAKAVQKKPLSSCSNMEEMSKLVAAKLMVSLGTPVKSSNAILKKQDLQNQATYEHKKLMSDANFRRKVLTLLSKKAAEGNETCARTVRVIMAK